MRVFCSQVLKISRWQQQNLKAKASPFWVHDPIWLYGHVPSKPPCWLDMQSIPHENLILQNISLNLFWKPVGTGWKNFHSQGAEPNGKIQVLGLSFSHQLPVEESDGKGEEKKASQPQEGRFGKAERRWEWREVVLVIASWKSMGKSKIQSKGKVTRTALQSSPKGLRKWFLVMLTQLVG